MELSTLTPGPRKWRKRKGRGPSSGNGKTCGRGHKGQKSRSGAPRKRGFEGGQMPLNRRLPKRGFWHEGRYPMAIINLDLMDRSFEDGAEITGQALFIEGLIPRERGGVKVLGRGELTKKFVIKVQAATDSARQKIEAAGGTVEIVPLEAEA